MPSRTIDHPGPRSSQRIDAVPVRLHRLDLTLQAGRTLLQAVTEALAPHAHRVRTGDAGDGPSPGAVLELDVAELSAFSHVLPALARDGEHAVGFSDRFDAAGGVRLAGACVTFGRHGRAEEQRPWLHMHAGWIAAGGAPAFGHVLPEVTVLAATARARAWLLEGAVFEVQPDPETRFSLFRPVASAGAPGFAGGSDGGNDNDHATTAGLAVRLAPDGDVCSALEVLCRHHGWTHATVRGGVGSTVGAAFADGRCVDPIATELRVTRGHIRPGPDGAPYAEIDVALVDHTGALAAGRLARGANAVLVTFECVLEQGSR